MIKHFGNLGFTVVAKPDEYVVQYIIYDHEGQDLNGKFLFHKKNGPSHPDPVEKIEDAESYLHGEVKWDGCSNWHFDEQDRVMLHGCGKEDVTRFGLILGECWELTQTLCLHWMRN